MIGNIRRFDLKYAFEVRIDGLTDLAFATCSEPSVAIGEAMLWQGGSQIPIKEPTRLTFNDVTLERGSCRDIQIYQWFESVGNAAIRSGAAGTGAGTAQSPLYKRNAEIYQKDRLGSYKEGIRLFNAFPKEYSVGDFSNDADEFRIERLVLSYDYFKRIIITPF